MSFLEGRKAEATDQRTVYIVSEALVERPYEAK